MQTTVYSLIKCFVDAGTKDYPEFTLRLSTEEAKTLAEAFKHNPHLEEQLKNIVVEIEDKPRYRFGPEF